MHVGASCSGLLSERYCSLASNVFILFNSVHLAQMVCRLNASHKAAEKYIQQFPSPALSHAAKFVAFLAGSFAALLLFMALVDDMLLERHLFGRNLVW